MLLGFYLLAPGVGLETGVDTARDGGTRGVVETRRSRPSGTLRHAVAAAAEEAGRMRVSVGSVRMKRK